MPALGIASMTLKVDFDFTSLRWAILHMRVLNEWRSARVAIDRLLNGR